MNFQEHNLLPIDLKKKSTVTKTKFKIDSKSDMSDLLKSIKEDIELEMDNRANNILNGFAQEVDKFHGNAYSVSMIKDKDKNYYITPTDQDKAIKMEFEAYPVWRQFYAKAKAETTR